MIKVPEYAVLIAAYNAEPFLTRAVDSAQNQTHSPQEILVVDDASTDNTRELVRSLASKDTRIRLLELAHNGGPSAARNAGIRVTTQPWIAVLDADDAFAPDRMRKLLTLAQSENADIVADNFLFFDPAEGRFSEPALREGNQIEAVTAELFVRHARPYQEEADWGLLQPVFRTNFLRSRGLEYPTDSRHGEDFILIVRALFGGAKYVLSREPGYFYTHRSSGFSRTKIDYESMIRHSLDFVQDPRVVGNAPLMDAFFARISALKCLKAERDFENFRRDNDFVSILKRALESAEFRQVLNGRAKLKLGRLIAKATR